LKWVDDHIIAAGRQEFVGAWVLEKDTQNGLLARFNRQHGNGTREKLAQTIATIGIRWYQIIEPGASEFDSSDGFAEPHGTCCRFQETPHCLRLTVISTELYQ
jgi:hypothetical protein